MSKTSIKITNVELNSAGIQELLKSQEIKAEIEKQAHDLCNRVGAQGYGVDTYEASSRVVASVYTATKEAKQNELENNSLIKALR